MQLLLLLVTTLITATTASEYNGYNLTGEHVCQQEERYFVNVTRNVQRNATVRTYVWCLNIPPRCSTFKLRTYEEEQTQEEERIRKVPVCCDGYEPNSSGEMCLPKCNNCVNGVCDAEHKCYCHPGFRGDHCERGCEFARWGRYCRYHCTCERGDCDPVNGHCTCPNGWIGTRCEQKCHQGYFGQHCKQRCQCQEGEICNPSDGRCLSKDKTISPEETHSYGKGPKKVVIQLAARRVPKTQNAIKNENADVKNIIGVYLLTTTPVTDSIDYPTTTSESRSENALEQMVIEDNSNLEQVDEEENKEIIKIPLNKTYSPKKIGEDSSKSNTTKLTFSKENVTKEHEYNKEINSTMLPSTTVDTTIEERILITKTNNGETTVMTTGFQRNEDRKDGNDFKTPSTTNYVNVPQEEKTDTYFKKVVQKNQITTVNSSIEEATEENVMVDMFKRNVLFTEKNKTSIPPSPTSLNFWEQHLKKNSSTSSSVSYNDVHFTITKNALVGIVSSVLAVFVFLLGVGFYATARIKEHVAREGRQRQKVAKMEEEENEECKVYSFRAKSIFHFPLPDPPDNYNRNTIKSLDTNTTFKSFSTTKESTYKSTIDYLELFYDQPPSRGSYRANTAPQPPSPTLKEKEEEKGPLSVISEPIYDEIPSQNEEISKNPLYANSYHDEILTKF